ncbi:MAG: hypothetical protein AAGC55_18745, partial [Myxococcota bacterium]
VAAADRLDPTNRKLRRSSDPPFGSHTRFVAMLCAAAVARIWMALFLAWRTDTGSDAPLAMFIYGQAGRRIAGRLHGAAGIDDALRVVRRGLCSLTAPSANAAADDDRAALGHLAELRSLYRHMRALAGDALLRTPRTEFLDWLWPPGPSGASAETRLCYRALCYLTACEGRAQADRQFAALFWQYQRVRGQLFRYLVQEPGTRGLDWFSQYYRRISPLRRAGHGRAGDDRRYEQALRCQSRGLRLAGFEARTSPERTWEQTWREVRAFAEQAGRWQSDRALHRRASDTTEMGLVLHLVKEEHCRSGRMHGDPRHAAYNARYAVWFTEARIQLAGVERMLAYAPESLLLLRGMDVANLELTLPNWVSAGLLCAVRRASGEAARVLARRYPALHHQPVEPLRMTHHVGEDIRSIGEGLRRVHELIACGVIQRGDRIGHGLVLGTDCQRWRQSRPYFVQPAEERLDDLLWEWERYTQGQVEPPPGRGAYVQDQAMKLGRAIYGLAPAPGRPAPAGAITQAGPSCLADLIEARQLRHRPAALSALGYPRVLDRPPSPVESPARALLWRYLSDPDVFERGQQPLEIAASAAEMAAASQLQTWLRQQVASRSITVESNPTSNLLIADMVDIEHHPSFILQPLHRPGAVPLSINTDNPLTFATCLADEYAYLYNALVAGGVA